MTRRRYRQVKQPDGSHKLVEITTDVSAGSGAMVSVGDFEPYASPIDGTLVTTHRQHEDHKKKHGVVEHREYGTEHWDRAAKKRADYFAGKRTTAETLARKQQINETINRFERG